jgi:hypothetical protein
MRNPERASFLCGSSPVSEPVRRARRGAVYVRKDEERKDRLVPIGERALA